MGRFEFAILALLSDCLDLYGLQAKHRETYKLSELSRSEILQHDGQEVTILPRQFETSVSE